MKSALTLFIVSLLIAAPAAATTAPAVSDHSIYQLDAAWTDDAGAAFRLASLQGHPVVIAMIFTRCGSACPVTVEQMKELERALPQSVRTDTRFVLVSFDSEGDTPAILHAYREHAGLNTGRWILLHGQDSQIRELAMVLGVSYNQVGAGVFSHSTLVSVLNRKGEIAFQQASLQGTMKEAERAVKAAE